MKRLVFIFSAVLMLMGATASQAAVSQDEVTADLIKEVNVYRASYGLSPVQTSKETCDFAKIRAREIATDFSHEKFKQRYKTGTLPYQPWREVSENIAMTTDYKKVISMWAHSRGHAINMRANTPYVCIAQYGNYFAYVGMRPK